MKRIVTAADTNILTDLLGGHDLLERNAIAALRRAQSHGVVVICDIVYAEICVLFDTQDQCDRFLARFQIKSEPLEPRSSFLASRSWISYLRSGGKRLRILPDFRVAGHATHQADQLLTRDRGFYRSHFPKLKIVDPAQA